LVPIDGSTVFHSPEENNKAKLIGLMAVCMEHIILKVGHPKIISTQISAQKILMSFVSHYIPKWNGIKQCSIRLYPQFKGSCELLPSLGVRRPSVHRPFINIAIFF
jgi:hypothetical protein